MNRSVLGLTTVLLMSALIIGGCGSNQDDHDTSLKVRTITIGEEAGTTSVFGNHQESDGNESSIPGGRPRD